MHFFLPLVVLLLYVNIGFMSKLVLISLHQTRIDPAVSYMIVKGNKKKREIQSWNPILSDVDPTAPDKLCRISFKQAKGEEESRGKKNKKRKIDPISCVTSNRKSKS